MDIAKNIINICKKFIYGLVIFGIVFVNGCRGDAGVGSEVTIAEKPPTATVTTTPTPNKITIDRTRVDTRPTHTSTATSTPEKLSIWFSPAVPVAIRTALQSGSPLLITENFDSADIFIQPQDGSETPNAIKWVYAVVASFPTLIDGYNLEDLQNIWRGKGADIRLVLAGETFHAMTSILGQTSSQNVKIVDKDDILDITWTQSETIAIIPFEEIQPRFKVLKIDGLSPFDQDFAPEGYPLTVSYEIITDFYFGEGDALLSSIPETNRKREAFTSVILTGTTALVRYTAERMETMGMEYPALEIGKLLRSADITHISNEISFADNCPPVVPVRQELRFCMPPSYIDFFDFIDADVIELTGNHVVDWGKESFLKTLAIYDSKDYLYYGGGYNLSDSQDPLKIENNGNRIAFLGCNRAGPVNAWATESIPGAAPCDFELLTKQISTLRSEGYLPIVTFQHYEVDDFMPMNITKTEFGKIAEAGAVIVSGSQAHFPHGFAFAGDNFIHYGLGNLFFDQMFSGNRREFVDRHIFYEGKYLGTEIFTLMLEDCAQPRFMTSVERTRMLTDYFAVSGWQP